MVLPYMISLCFSQHEANYIKDFSNQKTFVLKNNWEIPFKMVINGTNFTYYADVTQIAILQVSEEIDTI